MSTFYRVVEDVEGEGCAHCGHGKHWTIVSGEGDAEVGIGTAWGDQELAQDICELMNMAFDAGEERLKAQRIARLRAELGKEPVPSNGCGGRQSEPPTAPTSEEQLRATAQQMLNDGYSHMLVDPLDILRLTGQSGGKQS